MEEPSMEQRQLLEELEQVLEQVAQVLEELELCEAVFADELTIVLHADNAQPSAEQEA